MHTKAGKGTTPESQGRQGHFFQRVNAGGFFGKTTETGNAFFGHSTSSSFISRSPFSNSEEHTTPTSSAPGNTTPPAFIQRKPILARREEEQEVQRKEENDAARESGSGSAFAAPPADDNAASGNSAVSVTPVGTSPATLIQRDIETTGGTDTTTDPFTSQADEVAPLPPATSGGPARLRVDALGQDVNANEPLAYAAANTLGTDIRTMSLENLIDQLEAMTADGACIESLTIWHHGSPGSQLVNGMYIIQPRDSSGASTGPPYRLAESAFNISWLTTPGNQANLNRLRRVFCCNARMNWIGCLTLGIHTEGGMRTRTEQRTLPFHSLVAPNSYSDAADVAEHGASLYGATFGDVNAQLWANALCVRIVASREIVRIDPGTTTPAVRIPTGALTVITPQNADACTCDETTGRMTGTAPTVEEITAQNQALTRERMSGLDIEWHNMLRSFRTYVPVINPPNLVESGWAAHGGAGARSIEPGSMQERVQRDRDMRPLPDHVRQAIVSFFRLLQYAAAPLTPPAPLPAVPMDSTHRPFMILAQPNYSYAAATFPHLAVCYPGNFWRWMVFNDVTIGQTPEYTRSVIYHEMEHAADIFTSLQQYQAAHGPAPAPPADFADRCRPIETGVRRGWTDAWGQYVNNFVDFYNGNLPATRHLEIIVNQANMGIDHWSSAEQLSWIRNLLEYIPGDLRASDTLIGETEVVRLYTNANPHLREVIIDEFVNTFNDIRTAEREMDLGSWGSSSLSRAEQTQQLNQLRARCRTILNHFTPIVNDLIRLHYSGNRHILERLAGMPAH